ncbi:unnamed protein product [Acanthoscelides obtectus]|uniref:Complement component 1 Q subcomponent-binding protein, mitochondrial n=1 Tax=Acanthoscelides obtectus TaxID=200917 RepID=A0A9P0JP39_ACAOB|nr:unnamed protein product [Acanthoscelides obtectus]CAK1657979.1 Complement component 1 Q subcomponent-binding protein, mitochondrial [Acanthoscelides obtectus]
MFKAALRLTSLRSLLNPVKNVVTKSSANQQRQIARSLWYMCNTREVDTKHGYLCSCGCKGSRHAHTKAAKELVEFLTEEILAERKAQKVKTIPTEVDGFNASLSGAEVTLTKQAGGETVKITFNVNHSVDTDDEPEVQENMDKPEIGELKSKPAFKVELVRGSTTLSLMCSFISQQDQQEEGYNDIFGIDEVSIYEGEWNENVYSVSGEVIDSVSHIIIFSAYSLNNMWVK